MHLLAKQTNGCMKEFEVDDDFLFAENLFSCTLVGYIRFGANSGQYYVHRYVAGLKPGDKMDAHHVDSNINNNKRSNIRIITHQENLRCKGPNKKNSCGLKGVVKTRQGRYQAYIGHTKGDKAVRKCLGTFATKNEAGLAYDRAALARFAGAFLNFPEYVHQSIATSLG